MLLIAASPRAYVGGAIFGTGLVLLFATSAAYHLLPWPSAKPVLKRADHVTIFVFIAATYTPFCLMVFSGAWGVPLLIAAWSFAVLGGVLQVWWAEAPRWLGVGLYLGVGWLALVAAWPLAHSSPEILLGLVAAGILFSVGSLVYAFRRPDPFPRIFGYHEIFHLFVIAGVVIDYGLIAGDVIRR